MSNTQISMNLTNQTFKNNTQRIENFNSTKVIEAKNLVSPNTVKPNKRNGFMDL